jgi:hypothetical protein
MDKQTTSEERLTSGCRLVKRWQKVMLFENSHDCWNHGRTCQRKGQKICFSGHLRTHDRIQSYQALFSQHTRERKSPEFDHIRFVTTSRESCNKQEKYARTGRVQPCQIESTRALDFEHATIRGKRQPWPKKTIVLVGMNTKHH